MHYASAVVLALVIKGPSAPADLRASTYTWGSPVNHNPNARCFYLPTPPFLAYSRALLCCYEAEGFSWYPTRHSWPAQWHSWPSTFLPARTSLSLHALPNPRRDQKATDCRDSSPSSSLWPHSNHPATLHSITDSLKPTATPRWLKIHPLSSPFHDHLTAESRPRRDQTATDCRD